MSGKRSKDVLLHIDDAQAWLLRAKANYQSDNTARGEMDLSLAQAETRYAWELSRGRVRAAEPPRRAAARKWWLPVAACLGLGLMAAVVLPLVPRRGSDAAGEEQMLEAAVPAAAPEAVIPEREATVEREGDRAPAAGQTVAASALASAGIEQNAAPQETTPAAAAPEQAPPPGRMEPETVARTRDNPPAPPEKRPAGTAPGLGVDLGELERMAKEILFVGEKSGQH